MTARSSQKPQDAAQKSARTSGGGEDSSSKNKGSQGNTASLSVRCLTIEPRENEPPRISLSITYTGATPGLKALKAAARRTLEDVASRETLVDMGEEHGMQTRQMTKRFALEDE